MGSLVYNDDCDTLDTLPEIAVLNAKAVEMVIFEPWKKMIGFVVQGGCSRQWQSTRGWGERTVTLSNGEIMQMRITPKGCIGQSQIEGVIVVSTVIYNIQAQATVQTAFLWNPHSAPFPDPDLSGTHATEGATGCRNLHILMPSLFNHHDPSANNTMVTMGSGKWPITDRSNYHSVKPSTYTVMSYDCPVGTIMKDKDAQVHMTGISSATPGLSTYVVAGALAGADVEDKTVRSALRVKYRDWQLFTNAAQQQIEKNTGPSTVTDACNSAMTLLDALSAEGIIGMLSFVACDGALPEHMHRPGGIPLIIAAMMRISAHPERHKDLMRSMNADQVAVEELNFLFETHDAPFTRDPDRFWAIDLAIRRGMTHARETATKRKDESSVPENLVYIQRAGLQCAKSIFGSVRHRDDPDVRRVSKWGRSSLVDDPLEDAKQRVMAKKGLTEQLRTESVRIRMAPRSDMRITLVKLMHSVEHWLRTGSYAGMQINKKNSEAMEDESDDDDAETVALRIHRIEEQQRKIREKHQRRAGRAHREILRQAFKAGNNAAFDELASKRVEEGLVSQEQVRKIANDYGNRLLFGDSDGSNSASESDSDDGPVEISPIELQMQTKRSGDFLKTVLNVDAMYQASQALSSLFCNGTMVHQQLDVHCWLSSPYMKNKCADCEQMVHVLPGVMLQNAFSHCWKCKRRRCLSCRDAAAARHMTARQNKEPVLSAKMKCCLRCEGENKNSRKSKK